MEYDLSKCIGFVTNTAIKTITENFNKRLEQHGLTRIQWIALYFLLNADQPMGQKELSSLMNIKESSLVRLLDRMSRDGLIQRVENATDRRMKYVMLSDSGRGKAIDLYPLGKEFSDLLLKEVSDEEVAIFQQVLNKMLQNINEK
ncbi:MarR family winged helix-turn-helix transcriptional regulator [Aminipila butyrica]|uniref:MarR family winged helix-turn-helix transcriptional regulator n=1 Tax=Aminipila butyrica TaxID=433296 RepID=UPI001FEB0554|nr:MarR family transcriptional regulator [Aminipila butyrica]